MRQELVGSKKYCTWWDKNDERNEIEKKKNSQEKTEKKDKEMRTDTKGKRTRKCAFCDTSPR